jgi:hypothetical protein
LKVKMYFRGTRWVQIQSVVGQMYELMKQNPKKVQSRLLSKVKYRFNLRRSSYPLISGDTFRKISDFVWEKRSKTIDPESLGAGDVIFCESELAYELNEQVLAKTDFPVVLLLGNSDLNQVKKLQVHLANSQTRIFAQNLLQEIPNFEVLPIGIENSWHSWHGDISRWKLKNIDHTSKKFRVMWAFSIGTNVETRSVAASDLSKCALADHFRLETPASHQDTLKQYAFVASPPGNGLDTHRMWEALYFKTVPIVLRSYMTEYYENIGLPVWIVDSFKELQEVGSSEIQERYMSLYPRFNHPAIWAEFWIAKIRTASRELKAQSTP